MEYQSQAVPIRTRAELEAASTAGARFEFTAYGPDNADPDCRRDSYGMPPAWTRGSGGWVNAVGPRRWVGLIENGRTDIALRAFYPQLAAHDRYMAATAVLRDEE